MGNRYFVCTRNRPPVEFDIRNDRPVPDAEIAYFIRGFRLLEQRAGLDGHTVCFAWSSRVRLPVVGEDVIALIYGDEHCRIPFYAGRVGAVIKCHGLFPTIVLRRRPLRLAQIELAEFGRNLALWMPAGWRWLLSGRLRRRCHLVPIGYGLPSEATPRPLAARRYVASFLGSIPDATAQGPLRRVIGTPKHYCRRAMMHALEALGRQLPAGAVRTGVTGGFQDSLLDQGRTYTEVLADSMICVAPRGTTHETWRIADGLRLGCVVVADRLPRHPFYRDAPILQIEDWRDMPALVHALLADPARMEALSRRGLAYWQDVLSEEALAARLAGVLGLRGAVQATRRTAPAAAAA